MNTEGPAVIPGEGAERICGHRSPFPERLVPGVAELWKETKGERRVCIAVLDGAVDLSHPALRGADITQRDALGRAGNSGALSREHGTHVASIIFGRGPVRGIAPNCRGLVIPIYRDDGIRVSCTHDDLAKAINEAIRLGAQVINISGGELSESAAASENLRLAIRNCVRHGRIIVAAAGNDGCRECLHVPGALPSVLAVGAMDWGGEPLANSNWGGIYKLQGILAPGLDIPGAVPNGQVQQRSGSSFAAPIVSGVAGLLLSLQRKRGQRPNPFFVREALLRTARGCAGGVSTACDRILAGRLNVRGAVQFLITGGKRMAPQITTQGSPEDPTTEPRRPTEAGTADDSSRVCNSEPPRPTVEPSAPLVHASKADDGRTRTVHPSGCGCQGGPGQKVFVIGDLDIDFVSPSRRDSLQANAPRLPAGLFDNALENRGAFLRYLLGIDFQESAELGPDIAERVRGAIEEARGGALLNGNFYDAESVTWVLKQSECPMYAIRPYGAFAAAAYHQLAIFLIEQTFANYKEFGAQAISERCLNEFYTCYGGTQQPFRESLSRPETVSLVEGSEQESEPPASRRSRRGKAEGETSEGEQAQAEPKSRFGEITPAELVNRAFDVFAEPSVSAAHIAIAGEITGTTQLYTGKQVEVIAPAMRGMQNWNTRRLIEAVLRSVNMAGFEGPVTLFVLKIVSRLYDLVQNPGKDPCDRAINYVATRGLLSLAGTLTNPAFLSMLGAYSPLAGEERRMAIDLQQFLNIAVDDLECKPARCVRYGSEPYDVELSFYNFANQFMGSAVYSQTIDVSDVVPVAMNSPRIFPRRS